MQADGVTDVASGPADVVHNIVAGRSARHIVTGEIGSGKSWFAAAVAEIGRENDLVVVEVGCVEFETDVAYLPLSLILSQLGVRRGDDATLDAVFGADVDPPNKLSLGTAVAEVLHERSFERPVLVVIDDAHFADADSLQALLFAARRLDVASVGFVLTAVPGANARVDSCGLDDIRLDHWSADRVVEHLVGHGFAVGVARECAALTGGNPLAVSLLVDALDDDERNGIVPLPPAVPMPATVAARVDGSFVDLDDDTQLAFAVAAALPDIDAPLLRDALERCGAKLDAVVQAAFVEIVEIEPRVRWASPIVRSAALRLVDRPKITVVHHHIAEAATARGFDDLALRHRAAAGIGIDDEMASQLEGAARDAVARGAPLTAAEAFRQAALASSDPAERGRRLYEAANQAFGAGNSELALPYARAAIADAEGEHWASATSLLGEALLWTEGWAGSDRTLCDGARLVGETLPTHALVMLIHATIQAVVALDAPAARERHDLALAAGERSPDDIVHLANPVVGATAVSLGGGSREADPVLREATDLARAALAIEHPIGSAVAELVGFAAVTREETEDGIELLRAANDVGRRVGSVGMSAITSFLLTDALWRRGQWMQAQVEIGQALALARDSGFEFLAECGDGYRAFVIAATGRRDECLELAQRSLDRTEPRRLRFLSIWAHAAIGLCHLSDGDPAVAADAYDDLASLWSQGEVHEPNLLWWQADHVESLALAGRTEAAQVALDRFAADAELTGRPHALAGVTRCRALLTDDPEQRRRLLDESLEQMRNCDAPFDVARGLLIRGQDRLDAGDEVGGAGDLAEARTLFDRLGAHPWSDRASAGRHEAASTPSGLADVLTEAELRVALAIADGAQNREAAEQLFVSTKTVEYHLSNIYRKLGLRSRVDLARYVSDQL